jgi:hypothetical protein
MKVSSKKGVVSPLIIHFHRIFHEINHQKPSILRDENLNPSSLQRGLSMTCHEANVVEAMQRFKKVHRLGFREFSW